MSGLLLCHYDQNECMPQKIMRSVPDNKGMFPGLKSVTKHTSQDPWASRF